MLSSYLTGQHQDAEQGRFGMTRIAGHHFPARLVIPTNVGMTMLFSFAFSN
jgi:hypothetical protein